jgi:hypothetical protein
VQTTLCFQSVGSRIDKNRQPKGDGSGQKTQADASNICQKKDR